MANTASVGKPKAVSGAVFVAPKGTAVPTDATTALNEAFKSVGYISEDGVTNTISKSSETINSWGKLPVLTVLSEQTDEFKFTMISPRNEEALKLVFGASNVTVDDGAISVKVNAAEPDEVAVVIEMIVAGKAKRIIVPRGKLTDLGDIVYSDTEAIGYEVTVSALADDNDNQHYEEYAK